MEEILRKQLAELEQKYQSLMNGTNEAVLLVDPLGKIIESNNKAAQLLGYSKEELIRMHLANLYPQTESRRVMSFFNDVLEKKNGSLDDVLLLKKDGKIISIGMTSSVVEWVGRKVILGFISDLTERKQADTLVARFSYFSELNPNPIVELDMSGRVCYVNPVVTRLFPDLHLIGRQHAFLADLDPIIGVFQRGEKDLLMREIKINNVYYQQSLYCASDRQFIYVYGIDVTERKKAEMELLQSEKLSALGKFAAGIAHEVRNPLGIVLGGIEFLEQKLVKKEKDVQIAIDKVKEATLRATSILDNLLKFSKPYDVKIERLMINNIIDEVISLFKYSIPSKYMDIVMELAKKEICVEVDKNHLQQAIFNILINAVEVMPKGGRIVIKTYEEAEKDSKTPTCVVEITDNGPGISKENLDKIFEPFFTTKGKRGTGLGLTTARMIVNSYKGDIKIDSEPGKGTRARIVLPVA